MQLDLVISFITKHFKNHPEPLSQQMEADYQLLITNKKWYTFAYKEYQSWG